MERIAWRRFFRSRGATSHLTELQQRCHELAALIEAPESVLPTFERQRLETTDPDELLYWRLRSVASSMSSRWAARHRAPGEEFRVTILRQRLELLGRLEPRWEDRYRAEEAALLRDVGLA